MRESKYADRKEGIDTNALILDVLRKVNGELNSTSSFAEEKIWRTFSSNHLKAIQLAAWLFSMSKFQQSPILLQNIKSFLFEELMQLSEFVTAEEWLSDEDRSEEFVRVALNACELFPEGETMEDALDRLDALSTLKRNNVLSKSAQAYDRIIAIRKKMAEKKAREAANVYGRE